MVIEDVVTQRDYLDYTKHVHFYSKAIGRLIELSASFVPDAEKGHAEGRRGT